MPSEKRRVDKQLARKMDRIQKIFWEQGRSATNADVSRIIAKALDHKKLEKLLRGGRP